MPLLQRYRYFQPLDGRFVLPEAATIPGTTAFSLVYSGMIPAAADEPVEEVLERLLLRHASELRPHGREYRPVGAGDVFDLSSFGLWQVLPIGFRALRPERLEAGVAN